MINAIDTRVILFHTFSFLMILKWGQSEVLNSTMIGSSTQISAKECGEKWIVYQRKGTKRQKKRGSNKQMM